MTIEEALADVEKEGDTDPFKDIAEKETPVESSTPKEPEKEEPIQGGNTEEDKTPFNVRWKSHAENLKAELEAKHQEEIASLRQEFEQKLPKTESDIPDWFKELYGENQVAWEKYHEQEKAREAEIEKRILDRQAEERQKADAEAKYWSEWVNKGISGLEGQGLKFDRNELIKTMLEYRPTDQQGNFDFQAGYRIMEALKLKEADLGHSQARKQLADVTTKSSKSEKDSKDYLTSNDLRNKSWNQI
jgi:hypothetical protein